MSTFFYLTCQGAAAIRNSSIRVPAWWCSHCSACCRCRRSLRPWRCSSWRRARWRHRRWSCRCNMHMTSAKSISNSLPTSQFHIHATCHYFLSPFGAPPSLPLFVDVLCTPPCMCWARSCGWRRIRWRGSLRCPASPGPPGCPARPRPSPGSGACCSPAKKRGNFIWLLSCVIKWV